MTGASPRGVGRWLRRYGLRLAGLVLLVVILSSISLGRMWASLSSLTVAALQQSAVAGLGLLALRSVRWNLILRGAGVDVPAAELVGVVAESTFWGLIMPAKLGELKRVDHLTGGYGHSLASAGYLLFLDLVLDLSGPMLVGGTVLALRPALAVGTIPPVLAVGGLVLWIAALLAVPAVGPRLAMLVPFARGGGDLARMNPARIAALAVISCLQFICYGAMISALAGPLRLPLDGADILWMTALTMVVNAVPVTFLGLGTRDAALIGAFAVRGLAPEAAVSFSFLFLVAVAVLLAVCAGMWGAAAACRVAAAD